MFEYVLGSVFTYVRYSLCLSSFVCLYDCFSVCMSVCVFLGLGDFISMCLCVCASVSGCVCASSFGCGCVCVCLWLFECMFVSVAMSGGHFFGFCSCD